MDEPTDLYENENPDDFCGYCGTRLDENGRCPADVRRNPHLPHLPTQEEGELMPEYLVEFQRVGRSSNRVPPLRTSVRTLDDLADKIERAVGKYLASKGIDVEVYDGSGRIFAGGRDAGSFTWQIVK